MSTALRQKQALAARSPDDTVILSESEALHMQWDIISKWKPRYDVWPLSYGVGLLGGLASYSSYKLTKQYRKQLNLGSYAKGAAYIPLVVLPAIVGCFLHHRFVSDYILLFKSICPLCIETRSMVVQASAAVVYPLLLGPAATFYMARKLYTHQIPSFSKELWHTYLKVTRPIYPTILSLVIINIIAAAIISHLEARAVYKIADKIEELAKM